MISWSARARFDGRQILDPHIFDNPTDALSAFADLSPTGGWCAVFTRHSPEGDMAIVEYDKTNLTIGPHVKLSYQAGTERKIGMGPSRHEAIIDLMGELIDSPALPTLLMPFALHFETPLPDGLAGAIRTYQDNIRRQETRRSDILTHLAQQRGSLQETPARPMSLVG